MIRTVLNALRVRPATEQRASLIDSTTLEMMIGARSVAGPSISPSNAMSLSTVYSCVRVLAGDVAQMPLKLYRRLERGKTPAIDHPLYALLHDAPNPEMPALVFFETLMGHVLTWGNAYAEIVWGPDGYPSALWPLLPDRIEIARTSAGLTYTYKPDGIIARPPAVWRVLHIPGLGFDGLVGYSPVRLQMDTLGGERAQAEYGWRFFANGARPGVVLKYPGELPPETAARLASVWNESYGSLSNTHRTAVLQNGIDLEVIGVPPEEAQFLQTRQFTKREIAGWFRVPPQMIGDIEHATYASSEQFSRDYVVFTLGQWLRRIEQQIALKLLVGDERRQLVPQYVRDALIITQTNERFQAYASAIQSGVMTPNEAREKENMNPLPGGDSLMLPLNMVKADDAEAGGEGRGAAAEAEAAAAMVMEAWLVDALQRLTARIGNDVRQGGARALRRGGRVALDKWSAAQMAAWRRAGRSMLAPIVEACCPPPVALDLDALISEAHDHTIAEILDNDQQSE